eukprot:1137180-Pelagomonas_calceolata.AAC.3
MAKEAYLPEAPRLCFLTNIMSLDETATGGKVDVRSPNLAQFEALHDTCHHLRYIWNDTDEIIMAPAQAENEALRDLLLEQAPDKAAAMARLNQVGVHHHCLHHQWQQQQQ